MFFPHTGKVHAHGGTVRKLNIMSDKSTKKLIAYFFWAKSLRWLA